ncbi:MAG: hypothetical protein HYV06_00230 [Deltaproteobacteria bacterium]|nr:hypothetical protein [Deltaproteobacteria bacterium]
MKKRCLFVSIITLMSAAAVFAAGALKYDFEKETYGADSRSFSSFTGNWHIDRDGANLVYAVDGRKWEKGIAAAGVADKAKGLYGERYAEFLDNLEAYKYFPLTILKDVPDFRNGTATVSFKGESGRIDQAAGIAFNIKPNGDYLVVRANALENNLVLFKMERGRRSSVQWIRNVPTPSNTWHTLKVAVNGRKIEGYLNGKKYVDYAWKEDIGGKVGLWSKADSYVFFDNFMVETR